VRLTHYIGEPQHPDVPAESADDDEAVRAFRDRVLGVMEDLLAEGLRRRSERREPNA
jgi:hypothetical protein